MSYEKQPIELLKEEQYRRCFSLVQFQFISQQKTKDKYWFHRKEGQNYSVKICTEFLLELDWVYSSWKNLICLPNY